MPLFWARRNFEKPEERAIGFAYTFLGVRIECAQCHKHPFDQWSKDDFEQFAKLFADSRQPEPGCPRRQAGSRRIAEETHRWQEAQGRRSAERSTMPARRDRRSLRRIVGQHPRRCRTEPRSIAQPPKRRAVNCLRSRSPRARSLAKTNPSRSTKTPRPALMEWLRSPKKPLLRQGHRQPSLEQLLRHRHRQSNRRYELGQSAQQRRLLDHLASELIAHDFDLKWLHRDHLYQRNLSA